MAFQTIGHLPDGLAPCRAEDPDPLRLPDETFGGDSLVGFRLAERSLQLTARRPARRAPVSVIVVAAVTLGGIVWIGELGEPSPGVAVHNGVGAKPSANPEVAGDTSPERAAKQSAPPAPNSTTTASALRAEPLPAHSKVR